MQSKLKLPDQVRFRDLHEKGFCLDGRVHKRGGVGAEGVVDAS